MGPQNWNDIDFDMNIGFQLIKKLVKTITFNSFITNSNKFQSKVSILKALVCKKIMKFS